MSCYNILLTKGINYPVLRQAREIVSESDTRVLGLTKKIDTTILHALTTFYTPNPRYAVAMQELTIEYSVNQYLLLTVHVPSDMNPCFVAKQNECGIYYTIMHLPTTCRRTLRGRPPSIRIRRLR